MAAVESKPEEFYKVQRSSLREHNGELFVLASERDNCVSSNKVRFAYTVKNSWWRIHHDTPVMGAYELGDCEVAFDGPFATQAEADATIEKRSDQKSYGSYEYGSKVLVQALSASERLPALLRWQETACHLELRSEYFARLRVRATSNNKYYEPQEFISLCGALSKQTEAVIREQATEVVETSTGLVALANEALIEATIRKPFELECVSYNDPRKLESPVYIRSLGMAHTLQDTICDLWSEAGVTLSVARLGEKCTYDTNIRPAIKYGSINAFKKAHDFL